MNGSSSRQHPARAVAGWAAFLALALLGLSLFAGMVGSNALSLRALVVANRTYPLSAVGPGRYTWTLEDGRAAGGSSLMNEQALRFDENELVELSVGEGVEPGKRVEAGQILARVRVPRHQQRLAELQGQRESLQAERDLLAAGGRTEEVLQSQRLREVALARLAQNQAEVERLVGLQASGAVSEQELAMLRQEGEVLRREVAVTEAAIALTRSSARPEALSALDAQMRAVDAGIADLDALLALDEIKSPIGGLVQRSAITAESQVFLQVVDTSAVYLRYPLSQAERARVKPGAPVHFSTPALGREPISGEVVDVATVAAPVNGQLTFWSTARVDNASGLLNPGMMGDLRVELAPDEAGALGWIIGRIVGGEGA
jgi:hypothetical protein